MHLYALILLGPKYSHYQHIRLLTECETELAYFGNSIGYRQISTQINLNTRAQYLCGRAKAGGNNKSLQLFWRAFWFTVFNWKFTLDFSWDKGNSCTGAPKGNRAQAASSVRCACVRTKRGRLLSAFDLWLKNKLEWFAIFSARSTQLIQSMGLEEWRRATLLAGLF